MPSYWPWGGQVIDLEMAKRWPSYWPYNTYIYVLFFYLRSARCRKYFNVFWLLSVLRTVGLPQLKVPPPTPPKKVVSFSVGGGVQLRPMHPLCGGQQNEMQQLQATNKRTAKAAKLAKASAPYKGQNRQNREKRVSGSKNSHFPVPQKWALRVKKSPFSLWSPVEKWGFFDSKRPFLEHWEMGVFWPRNPLFPILAILTLVGGRRFRNAKPVHRTSKTSQFRTRTPENPKPQNMNKKWYSQNIACFGPTPTRKTDTPNMTSKIRNCWPRDGEKERTAWRQTKTEEEPRQRPSKGHKIIMSTQLSGEMRQDMRRLERPQSRVNVHSTFWGGSEKSNSEMKITRTERNLPHISNFAKATQQWWPTNQAKSVWGSGS